MPGRRAILSLVVLAPLVDAFSSGAASFAKHPARGTAPCSARPARLAAAADGAAAERAGGERASRLAVLLSVPVVWGTYAPVVRSVYAIEPAPPPGAVSYTHLTLPTTPYV